MNPNDLPANALPTEPGAGELLSPLLQAPRRPGAASATAVVVGELLALTGDTRLPIVRCPALLGEQSIVARSVVDLHGAHIGQAVVLGFEMGDPARPIVLGLLRGTRAWPLEEPPAQVEVDVDGQRMVINAKEQLVLRCGKASITLTRTGKVLIEGSYVLSRSTGVNRVKGGSVQLN